jgi:hypothetical protein
MSESDMALWLDIEEVHDDNIYAFNPCQQHDCLNFEEPYCRQIVTSDKLPPPPPPPPTPPQRLFCIAL